MGATERAREIVEKYKKYIPDETPDCVSVRIAIESNIETALSEYEKLGYERGWEDGIKNKCQLIAECKKQWIEECAKVARNYHFGKLGTEFSTVRMSNEIATAIERLISK